MKYVAIVAGRDIVPLQKNRMIQNCPGKQILPSPFVPCLPFHLPGGSVSHHSKDSSVYSLIQGFINVIKLVLIRLPFFLKIFSPM